MSTATAKYKKPKTTSTPDARTTTSTATRGGCINRQDNKLKLTAIAPYSHVGQTTSIYPTFTWFIPDGEYFPLEFHLEEYTNNSQLKTTYKENLNSKPGMMSLSLPQSSPGLSVGKKYRWKIVLRCTRYKAVVTMAEIEVVPVTPELNTAAQKTSGIDRRVNLYSSTGLWYNALQTTFDAADAHQRELQNQLIRELAAVETESNSVGAQQQGQKLNHIGDRL
ncbi:MAG: DUF928 domain-containing protein, partial [Cyanobacteria bacterium P01_G01_bin.19]